MKIDIEKYCNPECGNYRRSLTWKIRHFEHRKLIEKKYNCSEEKRKSQAKYIEKLKATDIESYRVRNRKNSKRWREKNPELSRKKTINSFIRWTLNNPRKAQMCAATGIMACSVIKKLNIRPTVCPHCGNASPHIDFHHPNHLFWWRGTFCCRSCHYFFNRGKVPASDTIIDLKKLLRESNSH